MIEGQFKPFQRLQLGDFEEINPGSVSSISFFGSATSSTNSITWPASIQAGDIAYLIDRARNTSGTPTEVIPSGFTQITSGTPSQSLRLTLSKKILLGSESGSFNGQDGTDSNRKVLLIFRGDSTINSSIESATNYELTVNNPNSQSVLASGGVAPLIVIGAAMTTATVTVNFSTASPSFDSEINPGSSLKVGYKIYNTSPADHTIDMNDQGVNCLASFYTRIT